MYICVEGYIGMKDCVCVWRNVLVCGEAGIPMSSCKLVRDVIMPPRPYPTNCLSLSPSISLEKPLLLGKISNDWTLAKAGCWYPSRECQTRRTRKPSMSPGTFAPRTPRPRILTCGTTESTTYLIAIQHFGDKLAAPPPRKVIRVHRTHGT